MTTPLMSEPLIKQLVKEFERRTNRHNPNHESPRFVLHELLQMTFSQGYAKAQKDGEK